MKRSLIASGMAFAAMSAFSMPALSFTLAMDVNAESLEMGLVNYSEEVARWSTITTSRFNIPLPASGLATDPTFTVGFGAGELMVGAHTLVLSLSGGATFEGSAPVLLPLIVGVAAGVISEDGTTLSYDVTCGAFCAVAFDIGIARFQYEDSAGVLGADTDNTITLSATVATVVGPPVVLPVFSSSPTVVEGDLFAGEAMIDIAANRQQFVGGVVTDDSAILGAFSASSGTVDPRDGTLLSCGSGGAAACFSTEAVVSANRGSFEGVESVSIGDNALSLDIEGDFSDTFPLADLVVTQDVALTLFAPGSANASVQQERSFNIAFDYLFNNEIVGSAGFVNPLLTDWTYNGTVTVIDFATNSAAYEQTFWVRNPFGPDAEVLVNVYGFMPDGTTASPLIGDGSLGMVLAGSARGFGLADLSAALDDVAFPGIFWAEFLVLAQDVQTHGLLGTFTGTGAANYTENPSSED